MAAREQRLGRARMAGGGEVAYALTGSGPFLLMAPGWLSHLELGWAIPAERMFHESLSSGRTLVRYDRPGCGLSDAYDGPRTMALELATIAAVTEELGITSCDVLGWSLGAAVAVQWAAAHPENVSRLVLYGGWATGAAIGDDQSRRHMLGLLASHWGLGSDLLTDLFAPDADAGTRLALARYQRAASSAETAVALLQLPTTWTSAALPKVQAPSLSLSLQAKSTTGWRRSPLDRVGETLALLLRQLPTLLAGLLQHLGGLGLRLVLHLARLLSRVLHRMGQGVREHQPHRLSEQRLRHLEERDPERQQDHRHTQDHRDQSQECGHDPEQRPEQST